MTRGNIDNPFGYQVKWRQADRNDSHALADALRGQSWDVVYDQICYTPAQAEAAVSLFEGRTGKYVLTSTLSVYQGDKIPFTEEDFDPVGDPQQLERSDTLDYGEAKRSTEAVLFQRSSFPVTAVRFPIVMGLDDYTKRLRFHIEHVLQEKTIGVPNPLAEMGYISSQEAADFLLWLGSPERLTLAPTGSSHWPTYCCLLKMLQEKKRLLHRILQRKTSLLMESSNPGIWIMPKIPGTGTIL